MPYDAEGRWNLALASLEVLELDLGPFHVDLIVGGQDGETAQVRFEAEFELRGRSEPTIVLDPSSWDQLAALFVLRRDTIRTAWFTRTADLYVEFASGRALFCVDPGTFESWKVEGPGGVLIIGVGKDPAIYDGTTQRRYYRWDDSGGCELESPGET